MKAGFTIVIISLLCSSCADERCSPIFDFSLIGDHNNLQDVESGMFNGSISTYDVYPVIWIDMPDGTVQVVGWSYLLASEASLSMSVRLSLHDRGNFSIKYDHPDSLEVEGTWSDLSLERWKDLYMIDMRNGHDPVPEHEFKQHRAKELTFANGKNGYVLLFDHYEEDCSKGYEVIVKPHIHLYEYSSYKNGTSSTQIFSTLLDSSSIPVNGCYDTAGCRGAPSIWSFNLF